MARLLAVLIAAASALAVAVSTPGGAAESPDSCCDADHRTAAASAEAPASEDGDEECPGPCSSCACCGHAPAAPTTVASTPVATFQRIFFADPVPGNAPDGFDSTIDRPPRG